MPGTEGAGTAVGPVFKKYILDGEANKTKKKLTPICTSPAARVRAFFLRGSHSDSSEGVATY